MATQTNPDGFTYDPVTGTPVDKATADNAAARKRETDALSGKAVTDANAATAAAANALQTANSYAGQIAQANTTAGSAVAIANGAVSEVDEIKGPIDTRLSAVETAAGYAPGDATDAAMTNIATQPNTEFRAALNAQIGQAGNVHIIGLWGQSNMSGRGAISNAAITDPAHPRIFQVGAKNRTLRTATEPLDHKDTPTGIGPGLQFARHYLRDLPPNDVVILTPSAMGSTPLVSTAVNAWQWQGAAGNLTVQALNQIQDAKDLAAAQWPGAKITVDAILWLQGEQDGGNNVAAAAYQTELDRLITETRTALDAPSLPFVLGPMMRDALHVGTRWPINTVHSETPYRVPATGYSLAPDAGPDYQNGDNLHYNAAGQRINGARMYTEYARVAFGLAPTISAQIEPEPEALWSDDFNRANGPVGTTATGDLPWSVAGSGAGTPAATVAANQLALSNTVATDITTAVVDSGTANGEFTVKLAAAGDGRERIIWRYVDKDNYVFLRKHASGANWALYHRTAGVDATVAAGSVPYAAGDLVKIRVSGNTLTVHVNGVQAMTSPSIAHHAAGTRYGVGAYGVDTAVRFDDAEFWELTSL